MIDALVTVEPTSVATASQNNYGNWIVTAQSDGMAFLTVSMDGISTRVRVTVSSDEVVIGEGTIAGISAIGTTPDYFDVRAIEMIANPALGLSGTAASASVFCWSEPDQSDINAKTMENLGYGNFGYDSIPVNDTPVNNYFNLADNINIAVYASLNPNSTGNFIGMINYNWINEASAPENYSTAFIAYAQDTGFMLPSELVEPADQLQDSIYSGSIGQNKQLEGVRISSNIEGVEVQTQVHAENIGWMNPVGDGVYAGTMHQNRQIESIKVNLTGSQAGNYSVRYRVHQENVGWSDWVSNGQEAGVTGEHLQLEAVQVQIVSNN